MDALVLTLYKKIDSHLDTPWLFVMIKRSHWGLVAVAHIEWQRAGDVRWLYAEHNQGNYGV